MIITQTPLRVSLLGGGTDFPDFYATEPGGVLSATIDKYVYVILKARYDRRIRVGYTRTEMAGDVRHVEHDLVREALRMTGVDGGVEMATMADIPSRGSGLGSSSAVTVGLLHALWTYRGQLPSRERLADGACRIELGQLERPIGRQDQYAAAYGGLNFIHFTAAGVAVEDVAEETATLRRLGERLLLFDTGIARRAAEVLAEQKARIEEQRPVLRVLRELAGHGRLALCEGRLDELGTLMDESWQHKRRLASRISSTQIDALYATARRAGAGGGKISGAGGGGYLLLYCPLEHQQAVRSALHGLDELEFHLTRQGSLVLLNSRSH
jgi:D-glycero-alpha-D-manno-heptose-7-phosphate kinase